MKALRKIPFVLFLLIICVFTDESKAQSESEKDSLESILPFANDMQRADILNGLANCVRSLDTSKAGNYARQAFALSSKLNYCKGKAFASVILGILQKNHGDLVGAKRLYLQGLAMALKCKEPYSVSFAYHSLGNLAYMQGDYGKTMRYYIASVKISEQIGDFARAARTYNNIGSVYMDLKNQDQAELYYQRSLDLNKGSQNELIVAEIENNLANIYKYKGYDLKALYHYANALEVFRLKSSSADISSALNNIGLVYLSRKQAKKALPYLREAYQLDLINKEPRALILACTNLSAAFLKLNQSDSALYFANIGYEVSKQNPKLSEVTDLYGALAELHLRLNDKFKSAFYTRLKQNAEQAILGQSKKMEIGLVASQYENERKEQQLKLMLKDNEIKQLKIIEQERAIERRNILLLSMFIAIFFLLLVSGLVIFSWNLNKKTKQFELSSKAKGNMLQQINHEIRTPLNGIVGMSQLALESKTFSELKDYLTYIKLSSDELMFLLNNLITHLQIDRKEAYPVSSPFDLLESLEELFKIYAYQAKHKGLLFNQMVFPGVPRMVNADRQKLLIIIQNLLNNAVKTCKKGVVKIEVKQLGSREKEGKILSSIQVVVSDEGPGFSDKEIKQLFKTSPQMGLNENAFGAGLKNVKELSDLMKGKLELVSDKGLGSSFYLNVEIESLDATENIFVSSQKFERAKLDHGKYNLLVVENNQLNQKLFAKILEKEGYPYQIAENGKRALEMLKERSYDLLLMNIRMPILDGISATHIIRTEDDYSIDKNIPILAITAHDDAQEKKKCFEVGMNDYLTKPINKALLLSKIEEQLRSKGF